MAPRKPMLTVRDLAGSYGSVPAVRNVSLEIAPGELRVILGANGAGKTTVLKAILGLLRPQAGEIRFGEDIDLLRLKPHQIHGLGIAWVPEGRQLWNTLTVLDNLNRGGFGHRDKSAADRRVGEVVERFAGLGERRNWVAGCLSGGDQQSVAIRRSLGPAPGLLVMDEPSPGLAPLVVRDVFRLVRDINEMGISILMVEQNADQAVKVAHWVYLHETGSIVE